jgi:hypothetical protein
MSCDVVGAAAAFLLFASNTSAAPPVGIVRIADAPAAANVDFRKEPLFVDIVQRAGLLLGQVESYRAYLKDDASGDFEAYGLFKQEVSKLSDMDFKAHQSLEQRGLDGDLKCILRGISADLSLKMADLDGAKDAKTKDAALKELGYLLNDNVEVITSPPRPPA